MVNYKRCPCGHSSCKRQIPLTLFNPWNKLVKNELIHKLYEQHLTRFMMIEEINRIKEVQADEVARLMRRIDYLESKTQLPVRNVATRTGYALVVSQ